MRQQDRGEVVTEIRREELFATGQVNDVKSISGSDQIEGFKLPSAGSVGYEIIETVRHIGAGVVVVPTRIERLPSTVDACGKSVAI